MARMSEGGGSPDPAFRNRFVGWMPEVECYVNLAGSYDYLSEPYYVSQDYEHGGKPIRPTGKEMLDAYVPPLFLEKAGLAGLSIPEYFISNGFFEPPVIVDPVNPFTLKGRVVLKPGRAKNIGRSLTRNFTYAICCQVLPAGSRVAYFRSVLGWCAPAAYRELAGLIWAKFNIPAAKVRVIRLKNGRSLLSDIAPLPFETLTAREGRFIEERIRWDS